MGLRNTLNQYGSVTKAFHWLIAVLVIGMLVFGALLGYLPKEYAPFAYNIHKITGISIFTLMILRLLWALVNIKPFAPQTNLWQRRAEYAVHYGLYASILAMPLAGWVGSMAAGRPPHLGDWKLTLPIMQDKALTAASFSVHTTLAYVITFLVTIHVLAALYHHFIKKDNILRRMLPNG